MIMSSTPSRIESLIRFFLKSHAAIYFMVISLILGVLALWITPREEEPQIVVPMADVLVQCPGASAEEVEKRVSSRLERMLAQIDGVEYVYSVSKPGLAVVTVRFFVGADREASLIKLYNKIFQNVDKVTPGISGWVVKPVEIDDVPIVNITLYSSRLDDQDLYRLGEELVSRLQHLENTSAITLHGGQKRVIQVMLDPERLEAFGMSPGEVAQVVQLSNHQSMSGQFETGNRLVTVETGPFLKNAGEVGALMIGVYEDRPVYLKDVAVIRDGAEDVQSYSRMGFGAGVTTAGVDERIGATYPAVTLAVAKKKGSNAVWVADAIEREIKGLQATLIPPDVKIRLTRNYGATADEKVNNLVESLILAILTVIGLVAMTMNWRVGVIVAIAVPITYALTLVVNYLVGYTINRVTLFALILALGLLVDDPIVGVENIFRHLGMNKGSRLDAISGAMSEVLSPIILATLSVIASFIPLFFITGMMGPYMRPMALNVPIAMLASMLVAFIITPWVSNKLLKGPTSMEGAGEDLDIKTSTVYRVYARVMKPLVESGRKRVAVLVGMVLLLVFSISLALTGAVPLKMLPFDNKNEFQIVLDMPEGTTLERTGEAVREIEAYLASVNEVVEFVSTVGAASPMDFNGLVRHYYLRRGAEMADIRVNLVHRLKRKMDSHSLVLRMRNDLQELAEKHQADIKLVEMPPGPPVLSTVVAEVYGTPLQSYTEVVKAAGEVKTRLRQEPGVVDVDDMVEAAAPKWRFEVDREKAGLHGIAVEDVVRTVELALGGMPIGTLHVDSEQNELPIILQLPREKRSSREWLLTIPVKGRTGQMVQLGEIGRFIEETVDVSIYHKNQERVVFVTAEMAGRGPAYAVLNMQKDLQKKTLPAGIRVDWRGEGEWKITLDVFRDMGLAFAAALLIIYLLLVYETGSYLLPGVIMMAIPMTLIGIMPGFWLLNGLGAKVVGGYPNPVFFTATAMIGMIALAGIVVRNGIILIDFIRVSMRAGHDLKSAIIESGAVRLRPIFLTAGTTLLGAWPITLDPIFSGLAWALIFGLFVSTAFTLVVIPMVYYMIYRK
jgi:multidrug efflux pump subunit AcrB